MAVAIVPGGPRGGWRGADEFVTADGRIDVVSTPIVAGLCPVSAQDALGSLAPRGLYSSVGECLELPQRVIAYGHA
jgi:hypothetical protein